MPRRLPLSGPRISLLCHLVNRGLHEIGRGGHTIEYVWAIDAAIKDADLPDSWKQAIMRRRILYPLIDRFRETGAGIDSRALAEALITTLESD